MKLIFYIFICYAVIIPKAWTQDSSCSYCGQFSWDNMVGYIELKIHPDHKFEYVEHGDGGNWYENASGTWRDSSNFVFLSSEPVPQIAWAEEGINNEDSVTVAFFSKDSQNISWQINAGLSLNGIVRKCKHFISLNASGALMNILIDSTRATEVRPLSTIDISVDQIILGYKVKNPKANVFRFGLTIPTYHMRFFDNEPYLFKDGIYYKMNKSGSIQRVLTRQK